MQSVHVLLLLFVGSGGGGGGGGENERWEIEKNGQRKPGREGGGGGGVAESIERDENDIGGGRFDLTRRDRRVPSFSSLEARFGRRTSVGEEETEDTCKMAKRAAGEKRIRDAIIRTKDKQNRSLSA